MKRPQHPAVHSDTVAPEIEEPAGSVEVADVATDDSTIRQDSS